MAYNVLSETLRLVSVNKNLSGDEIANVNFLTTISHTRRLLQNTEKETNLLRLTN